MQVIVNNCLHIKNPTDEINVWCKSNLTIPNPEYTKKLRMGFWTGNTPAVLSLYETHGDTLIVPYGTIRELLPMFNGHSVITDFIPPIEINYGGNIPLYDYQTVAVNECICKSYGILQAPAGSGKTQMGIALVKALKRRALWLTHTVDLLNQSKARAEKYMDEDLIGTITAGKVSIGKGITFATVQTMSKLDLVNYRDVWDIVIVDECHRVAGTPTAMTQFSKVLNNLSARHKYGLSATVHRSDGMIKATKALLGDVIYTVPDEAVKDKIMRLNIAPVLTHTQISRECVNTDGTLNYTKMITYLCENEERNKVIASVIKIRPQPSLILSDRLEHLKTLMDSLPSELREQAVMVSGKMTSKSGRAERENAIQQMRDGTKKYLFATYSLAKEGLDIPCLEVLYMTTPQKDYAVVTQSIGRIARTAPGKSDPICYDFVDDIGYLVKSYKKRCAIYRKNNCKFL